MNGPSTSVTVTDGHGPVVIGATSVHIVQGQRSGSQSSGSEIDTIAAGLDAFESKLKRDFSSSGGCTKRLPWLEDVSIRDYYVDLTIEERNGSGKVVKVKDFRYEQLFWPTKRNEKAPKTILIQGGAGFGKTTLSIKLVNDWASRNDHPISGFKLVILCRLRDVPRGQEVEDFILNRCSKSLEKEIRGPFDISDILKSARDRILIILDGYDEIGRQRKVSVKDMLGMDSFFHSSTIIVTSRPHNLQRDFINCFERHLHISALSAVNREKLVDKVFAGNPLKSESVKAFLRENKLNFLSELSPLLLFSVCSIFNADKVLDNITKGSDLIFEVTRVMFLRAFARQYPNKTLEEKDLIEILFKLGQLFFEKLKNRELYLKTEELFSIVGQCKDFFCKIGLFDQSKDLNNDGWEVIHKVFMDVLAVFYLNQTIERSENDDLSQVREHVAQCLGTLDEVQVVVFLQRRNVMTFSGHALSEIVYVAFEHRSVFDGIFCTFEDLKVQFREYIYNYKDGKVLVYSSRRSQITFFETFGNISVSKSRKWRIQFWPSRTSKPSTIVPGEHFKFEKCVIKISDSTENLLWSRRFGRDIGLTCFGCKDLKVLLSDIFDPKKQGNWSLTFRHRMRQFDLVLHNHNSLRRSVKQNKSSDLLNEPSVKENSPSC